jgi:hypothetical protein
MILQDVPLPLAPRMETYQPGGFKMGEGTCPIGPLGPRTGIRGSSRPEQGSWMDQGAMFPVCASDK